MKNNYKFLFFALASVLFGFSACKKNELRLTQFDLPADKSFVRFVLLSPGTPSVMIKVNGVKINGANTSGSGGVFPSTFNFPDYAAIAPNGTFRLSLPNLGTGNDSVLIFNSPLAVNAGKFYSVALADTGVDRTVFSLEDQVGPVPADSTFNIRVVNAMAKTGPINFIRIDSTSATSVVRDTLARNIDYKAASNFINTSIVPIRGFTFLRFRAVTTSGMFLGTVAPPSTSFNRRSVTTFASGFATGVSTLAPALSSFVYNK